MAVRIIKKGKIPKPPPPVVYGVKCWNCACVFECGDQDIETDRVKWCHPYCCPFLEMRFVKCPTCGTKVSEGYLERK